MKKQYWQNKWVFILAAIGSAAWLGNLWRFPYQVYDNGWAAFIIAYLVILLLIGFGLLIWEIALGQYTWKWAPGAFWTVSKYLKWLGWAGIFTAAVILSYYAVVIGWWLDYLWYSLVSLFTGSDLAWANNAKEFFFNNVLQITDSISNIWSISWPVLLWTIATWILVYLFTFKSVKSVWKVVLVTATLPFITLAVLAIRWATLPGAGDGLAYLFSIDWSKLWSMSTWIAAAGQIFFTLSLAMWIMIAYGALKEKDSEIVQSTIIVAIGNTIVSFLSAIAVFGTLWYLAAQKWVPVEKVVAGGPSLVFVTIPETINLLPALQSLFAVIFFVTVFFLAIDSAMSLVEAVGVAIRDKIKKLKVEYLTLIIVIILWLTSLVYTFGNGLYVLDIVDHFITSYSMLFIGMMEALVLLFIWKKLSIFIDERNSCKLKFIINKYYFALSWFLAFVVLTYLLYKNIAGWLAYDSYEKSYLIMYGVYVLVAVYALSILLNILDRKEENNE
jgi:NSS family neurotransmitter:Na+ symporter